MRKSPEVKFGNHHLLSRKPVQYPILTTYNGVIFCRIGVKTAIREDLVLMGIVNPDPKQIRQDEVAKTIHHYHPLPMI